MINKNELRLGNLFEDLTVEFAQGVKVVKSITETHVNNSPICNLVKPIPLTEEWLLKFGFEKQIADDINYHFDWWEKGEFNEGFVWQHDKGFCFNFGYGHDLDYVHTLQNLYFALTGEELTITE